MGVLELSLWRSWWESFAVSGRKVGSRARDVAPGLLLLLLGFVSWQWTAEQLAKYLEAKCEVGKKSKAKWKQSKVSGSKLEDKQSKGSKAGGGKVFVFIRSSVCTNDTPTRWVKEAPLRKMPLLFGPI